MSGTSSRYRKNYLVSWEQLQRDCRALAWKLLDIRADWSRIVAVARGGLVPAAVIARELNIRLVDTVCISSYTMRDQSASAEILKRPDLARVDETWLVVDDLVDTGKTAKIVREMFGGGALSQPSTRSPRAARSWTASSPRSARTHGCSSRGTRRRRPTSSRPSPK